MTTAALRGALAAVALLGVSCGGGAGSLVPGDYATRFGRTRDCRPTLLHMNPSLEPPPREIAAIAVWVNPEAAAMYNADANPLPAGTLVIKEEFADERCTDLVGWSVMRKEPGYDPAHGDWHWQHVWHGASGDRVDADGRVGRCSASGECHSGCTARDWMCTQ